MKIKKIISFILLIGFFIILSDTDLKSQQVRKLTLDQAIELALGNNIEAKNAILEVEKAEAAVREAYGYAYPSLDVSSSFSHFIEKPQMPFPDFETMLGSATYGILKHEDLVDKNPFEGVPLETKMQSFALANNFDMSANVTQILFNSAVFTGIGSSQIYLNMAGEMKNATSLKIITNVKKAYYGVLLTNELLAILKASLENAQKNLNNIKAMLMQGFVSEFDAMQVEVQVENIKPSIIQIENTRKMAMDGLKMAIGINPTEEIDIEGKLTYQDITLPEVDKLIGEAMDNNYDVNTLTLKTEVDQAFIEIAKGDYWPTVAAFGNYQYAGSGDEMTDFLTYNQAMVGVSFSMNLFNGMRTTNSVQQQKISKMQTENQIVLLRDALKMQIRTTISEIESVKSQIEAQERTINLAQRAYDLSNLRYKEGTGTQLEILNSDIALRTAKSNKLQSMINYINAQIDLDKILGKLDSKYRN